MVGETIALLYRYDKAKWHANKLCIKWYKAKPNAMLIKCVSNDIK